MALRLGLECHSKKKRCCKNARWHPKKQEAPYVLWSEAFDWGKRIPDGPLAHGFDYYFGDTVINFPPYCWIENDKVVKAPDAIMDTSKWKPIKEVAGSAGPALCAVIGIPIKTFLKRPNEA